MDGVKDFCHLCGAQEFLRESHVWPRFAYKEYVSDLERGGQFTDLQSMTRHGRQMKEAWLCDRCEQFFNRFETPAAAFLRNIKASSPGQFQYAPYFLPFTISMSWR